MKISGINFSKIKKKYLGFIKKQEVLGDPFYNKLGQLNNFYMPICQSIFNDYLKNNKTMVVGLSGGQGTGKTTIAEILKLILKTRYNLNSISFSIDDFYKTLKARKEMSKRIHELFLTRGVPGTHDINLVKTFFNSLKKKKFKKIKIPKFNKLTDDRFKKNYWHTIDEKPEIVLLEGWCVGAKAEPNSSLKRPINVLEKYEDPYLVWRNFVNEKLKKEYKKVFSMIDHYIYMKVPSFKMVFEWRLLQENKLKKRSTYKKETMSYNGIKRFIMFYQRITLQMLKDLSKSASIVMLLKKNHEVKKVLYK